MSKVASAAGSAHRTPTNPRGLKDLPFEVPGVTDAQKRRARRLDRALIEAYPDAHCELDAACPHELLIATILSAQTTDVGVNKATPGLFRAFPEPADYAKSTPEQIEPYIKTLGFFRSKAKSVHAAMTALVQDHAGQVPSSMDELLRLRGVARKTANVVLGNAFDINDGFVVDTHIMRLAWRFDLIDEDERDDPKKVERKLVALFPRAQWCRLSHCIIWHGRRACPARGARAHEHPICKGFGVHCPKG